MPRARIALLVGAAIASSAVIVAVAQQAAEDWKPALNWNDGRQLMYAATKAPGCDGSHVDLRMVNATPMSGNAKLTMITFACARGGEQLVADRTIAGVQANGDGVSSRISCVCADKGGVTSLMNANLEFTPEGRGEVRTENGCTYTGQFANGERSGRGTYSCPGGYRVEGMFQRGQLNGEGKETRGAQVYVGDFADGLWDGEGELLFTDAATYRGDFKGGKREGNGTMRYADHSEYIGEWKADQRSGRGTYSGGAGTWTYDGAWRNNLREGQGKLTYADGSYTYEGPFRADKREGQGHATFSDGRNFTGTFVNDEQNGPGVMTYSDGRTVTGEFRNHRQNGKAVDKGPNGTFDGMWVDGVLEGPAVVTYPDGTRFEGLFRNGKRNGLGIENLPSGTRQECNWVDDQRQPKCKKLANQGVAIEYRN